MNGVSSKCAVFYQNEPTAGQKAHKSSYRISGIHDKTKCMWTECTATAVQKSCTFSWTLTSAWKQVNSSISIQAWVTSV